MISGVNKQQSLGILYSLRSILKIGHSMPNAISLLAQVEKGHLQKVLNQVKYLIFKANIFPEDALERFKILTRTEVYILKNSTNPKEAIGNIIEMREISSRFEKSMVSLLAFPIIGVIIGLTIAYFAQPTFYDMVNTLVKQVELTKGVDVGSEVDLMWYLQSQSFDLMLLIAHVSIVVSLVMLYMYLIEYKPHIIYKMFPLKAYDDIPFILMMMNNLHRTGLDPNRIFIILEETAMKKGWLGLFRSLGQRTKRGEHLYDVFEKYGFPNDVILILKSAEIGRTFWDNMDSLLEYVKENNEFKNEMIKKVFGSVSTIIGFGIIIYFTIGLFMAMFSLQSISTALM